MKKKYILPTLISAITFMLAELIYYYTDLKSLTVWTLNIWDTLANSHNLRDFYSFSSLNLQNLDHAMVGSDILIYIPWAIWNLPIWILQHFAGMAVVTHPAMLLWSKLFLAVVFCLCFFPVKRIIKHIDNSKDNIIRMFFLSATSFFTITSLAYIGQNDVVVIFSFLMAISALLDSHTKSFMSWAALSIAFKPFFIFAYVGLVLLTDKNLLRIVGKIALGFSVFIIQKIPFIGAPMYKESLSYGPTSGSLKLLLDSTLDLPPYGASLFFLGLITLYAYAYFCDKELKPVDIIYMSVAPMIILFLFSRYEVYRPFYLVPIIYILMMCKPQFSRINLMLETLATFSLYLFYMMDDLLFYNPNYIIGGKNTPALSQWLQGLIPGFGYPLLTAVFAFCMILILILNHPSFKYENKVLIMDEEPYLLTIRSLCFSAPVIISILVKLFI